MPTYIVKDPKSGRKVRLTGETPPSDEELDIIFSRLPKVEEDLSAIKRREAINDPSTGEEIIGAAQTVGQIVAGAVAEPIAGLAGLAQTANPFAEEGAGAEAVEDVRNAISGLVPTNNAAQRNLQGIGETLEPAITAFSDTEDFLGDGAFDLASNLGANPEFAAAMGAAAKSLPTLALEATGLTSIKGFKRIKGSSASDKAANLIDSSERLGVPVLTTDAVPPTTFLGKYTQSMSEKLGPLGSGNKRASQQVARQNVVEELAKEFNIELDSDFAGDIVKSLNTETARKLERASIQRNKAVVKLDEFGNVPNDRTISAIEAVLARQSRLGDKADSALIKNMEDIKSAINQNDFGFSVSKDIRTEIIDDLAALRKADDSRAMGATQSVKSALDKDMIAFARGADRESAANWLRSNRAFADELTKTKQTELKRILNTGTATPEKVIPILMGGKRSEVSRLYGSLTSKGRSAGRAAIIKDVLDKSGFFKGDINPDRLATELGKTNKKQAIDIFFKGDNKKQLNGLVELLNATRRAQQSAAAPATGIQAVPTMGGAGLGFGLATDAITTGGVVGSLSAIAKAYESKPFRNLLLKIENRNKQAPIEKGLLESGFVGLTSVFQAAKAEQEQKELLQ